MTPLADIDARARAFGLCQRGAVPIKGDAEWGAGTVVLLGPDEPRFWEVYSEAPEHTDGQPDPLDRWSKRVVTGLARPLGARAVFPSDGPPYPPFLRWATESAQSFVAPPGLLVHADAGLLISFRAALILPQLLDLPAPRPSPCDSCSDRPCMTACPVGALGSSKGYDVPACAAHVRSDAGQSCRTSGCLVRRACPLSAGLQRPDAQASFHMSAFLGSRV